jgi:hypothetical protein
MITYPQSLMSQALERTRRTDWLMRVGELGTSSACAEPRTSLDPCPTSSPHLQEFQATTLALVRTTVVGKEEGRGGSEGPSTQLRRRTGGPDGEHRGRRRADPAPWTQQQHSHRRPGEQRRRRRRSLGGPAELIEQWRRTLPPPDRERAAQPPPARRAEEATPAPSAGQRS